MEKLRFKDENGNNYPEWETIKLGDIGKFKTSSVDKKTYGNLDVVNLVNYMDVYKGIDLNNDTVKNFMKVSATKNQKCENNLLHGDILFTPSSETPDDIGHSSVVKENLINTLYSYHLVRFRPEILLDTNYTNYFCNTDKILREFSKLSQGATRFTLSLKSFAKVKATISKDLKEQEKLGRFFNSIDKLVDKQRRKLGLLKEIKKSYLHKIFGQEIKFKDEMGNYYPNWEVVRAEKIFIGKNTKKIDYFKYPVLSATQDRGVILRSETGLDISYSKESVKNYKFVEKGDFVISLRSFQGGFEVSHNRGMISPAYSIFNFINSENDTKFYSTYFKTKKFIQKLKYITYGIRDGRSINFKDFLRLKIDHPKSKKEQKLIGNFLDSLDVQLKMQEQKLIELEQYKKGYMQRLFS